MKRTCNELTRSVDFQCKVAMGREPHFNLTIHTLLHPNTLECAKTIKGCLCETHFNLTPWGNWLFSEWNRGVRPNFEGPDRNNTNAPDWVTAFISPPSCNDFNTYHSNGKYVNKSAVFRNIMRKTWQVFGVRLRKDPQYSCKSVWICTFIINYILIKIFFPQNFECLFQRQVAQET